MAYRRTDAVRARLDATRAKIVDAASEIVHEHGYAGCSIAGVSTRAGVATGTIYRFFPSKGELFAEVFRHACAREVTAATQAGRAAGDSARAAILATVETFCARALAAPKFAYALIAEPVDPLVEAERLAFRDAYTDLLATAITSAIAAGELPAQDARVAGAGIVGAISEVLIIPLARGERDTTVVQPLLSFVQRALGEVNGDASGDQPGSAARELRRG